MNKLNLFAIIALLIASIIIALLLKPRNNIGNFFTKVIKKEKIADAFIANYENRYLIKTNENLKKSISQFEINYYGLESMINNSSESEDFLQINLTVNDANQLYVLFAMYNSQTKGMSGWQDLGTNKPYSNIDKLVFNKWTEDFENSIYYTEMNNVLGTPRSNTRKVYVKKDRLNEYMQKLKKSNCATINLMFAAVDGGINYAKSDAEPELTDDEIWSYKNTLANHFCFITAPKDNNGNLLVTLYADINTLCPPQCKD